MDKNIFTQTGLEIQRKRVARQNSVVLTTGTEVGEEAGPNCDWHDNAGFEDAQRRLEMESRRLGGLRSLEAGAQIIEVIEQATRVAIGNTVEYIVYEGEKETTKEATIGATGEMKLDQGLVTYKSPVAQVLLGLTVGDSIEATLNGRQVEVEVTNIFPPSQKYRRLIAELLAVEEALDAKK